MRQCLISKTSAFEKLLRVRERFYNYFEPLLYHSFKRCAHENKVEEKIIISLILLSHKIKHIIHTHTPLFCSLAAYTIFKMARI